MVSGLIFKSLIHYEFIFVYDVMSKLILLHVAVLSSQYHLLNGIEYIFSYCVFLPPLL